MVLVEPTNFPILEVVADHLDSLGFEVSYGSRMEKGACLPILLLTFFSPAAKIHANLLRQVGGEDIAYSHPGVVKPEHSHVCILALRGIICYCTMLLLFVLGLERFSINCCWESPDFACPLL